MKISVIWDKAFPQNEKLLNGKILFKNRFGTTLVAEIYKRKDVEINEKFPAIIAAVPFAGTAKNAASFYAQSFAARGFIALALDPICAEESSGEARKDFSDEIFAEDFSAAANYLATRGDVVPEQIGILGICDLSESASKAAAANPRIKAVSAATPSDCEDLKNQNFAENLVDKFEEFFRKNLK